jgi:hypothetical protein
MSDDSGESGGWAEAAWDVVTDGAQQFGEGVVQGATGIGEAAMGEITAVGETAYHAGAGVADAVTGDWDGAANEMGDMANSAVNFLTGGALGEVETGWDIGATAARAEGASDSEAPTSDQAIHHGLKSAGDWLGDEAYSLVHGSDAEASE